MDTDITNKKWSRLVRFLKKDSSGIALLLALGMLSLLFVIAVGFVSTTESDLKMAQVKASDNQARFLAESGLNAAMFFMKENFTDSDPSDSFRTISIGPTNTGGGICNLDSRRVVFTVSSTADSDWVCGIATNFKYMAKLAGATSSTSFNTNTSYFDWINDWAYTNPNWNNALANKPIDSFNNAFKYDPTDPTCDTTIGWQYVYSDATTLTDTCQIIGRYAFVIIDESEKANISDLGIIDTPRRGVATQEVLKDDYLNGISDVNINAAYGSAIDWGRDLLDTMAVDSSYRDIRYIVSMTGKNFAQDYKRCAAHLYYVGMDNVVRLTEEAYLKGSAKYARFNLNRNQSDYNGLKGWANLSPDDICATPTTYSEADSPSYGSNAIEWLSGSNWNSDAGTYTSGAARAAQIAANLIDYCDDDLNPKTNVAIPTGTESDPTTYTFSATVPVYCGLERGGRISEVNIRFYVTITKTTTGASPDPITYKYSISDVKAICNVEAFFLGLTKIDNTSELPDGYYGVVPHLSITAADGALYSSDNGTPLLTIANNPVLVHLLANSPRQCLRPDKDIYGNSNISLIRGYGDYVKDPSLMPASWPGDVCLFNSTSASFTTSDGTMNYPDSTLYFQISNLKIKAYFTAYHLGDSSAKKIIVDYADVLDSNDSFKVYNSNSYANDTFIGLEVDDPRQNHNADDWIFYKNEGSATGTGTMTVDLLNTAWKPNTAFLSSTGADSDSLSDGGSIKSGVDVDGFGLPPPSASPVGCSTRFIRNGAMRSPWELGAIHRAGQWQTLNLQDYSLASDGSFVHNGYKGGDAPILDQIKMNNFSMNSKFNANSKDLSLLKALFARVEIPKSTSGGNDSGYANDYLKHTLESELDTSTREAMANAMLVDMESDSSRVQIANSSTSTSNKLRALQGMSDDSSSFNSCDMGREAVIGKIVNLLKGGTGDDKRQRFSVIVLAQAIKDIGTPSTKAPIPFNVDINKDGLIGSADETDETLYGYRIDYDGDGRCSSVISESPTGSTHLKAQKGRYDQYIDKITGTAKIYAEVERDPKTKKYRIVSFNFMDESSETNFQ